MDDVTLPTTPHFLDGHKSRLHDSSSVSSQQLQHAERGSRPTEMAKLKRLLFQSPQAPSAHIALIILHPQPLDRLFETYALPRRRQANSERSKDNEMDTNLVSYSLLSLIASVSFWQSFPTTTTFFDTREIPKSLLYHPTDGRETMQGKGQRYRFLGYCFRKKQGKSLLLL